MKTSDICIKSCGLLVCRYLNVILLGNDFTYSVNDSCPYKLEHIVSDKEFLEQGEVCEIINKNKSTYVKCHNIYWK